MKKSILLLFAFIIYNNNFAQETIHSTEFKYKKSNVDPRTSTINQYVVIPMDSLTAKQAYDLILFNIKDIYDSPSEVISASEDGTFIKINGVAPNLFSFKSIGRMAFADIHYTLEIRFKDERIKIDLSRLDNATDYGFSSAALIYTHKKNGKKNKIWELTGGIITDYFNELVKSLTKRNKNTNLENW